MSISLRSWCRFVVLWAGLAAACHAAEPLTEQFLADARDGVFDQFDLPAASLIASGVTDERELDQWRTRIDQRLASSAPASSFASPAQSAEFALRRLHAELLTGRYDKHASDLRQTLSRGDFNCLSALVLYVELCRCWGLEMEIWSRPGHVYCRLPGSSRTIEPVSPRGMESLGDFALAGPARRITPAQLVGKFSYNRGVELLEKGQFEAGIEAMRLACRLDPDDADARTNLLAGLNNWALALAEQEQPSAAAALISRGLAIDPTFAPLVANEQYVRGLISGPR